MIIVELARAEHEPDFGGKAVSLGAAARAGLPVPPGVALHADLVDAVAAGDAAATRRCATAFDRVGARHVAVRSSAAGEDGESASFAGQHVTRLGIASSDQLLSAVVEVWRSARSDGALAYRRRLGIGRPPRIAVVVQAMVDADCAGVLFTRNPVDGSDERVIEAAWGLGETVVGGLVDPDRYRMRRGGQVIERRAGDKDVAIRQAADGLTEQRPVADHQRRALCLDDRRLAALEAMVGCIEAAFPGAHDVEWAFAGDQLYLLQRRAVTR